MKTFTFTILGRFAGNNDFIEKNRRNRYAGNNLKQGSQAIAYAEIKRQNKDKLRFDGVSRVDFTFYEKERRRDIDNIGAFAAKVVLDAMTEAGLIPDDSPKYIRAVSYTHDVDKAKPRVVVTITEIEPPKQPKRKKEPCVKRKSH